MSELRTGELIRQAQRRLDQADIDYPDVELGTPEDVAVARTEVDVALTGFAYFDAETLTPQFKYAFYQVHVMADGTAVAVEGGLSGTLEGGWAINPREINNTPPRSGFKGAGVNDAEDTDYPPGFKHQPIGGIGSYSAALNSGTLGKETIVRLIIETDPDGAQVRKFYATAVDDGTCEEEG